MTLSIASPLYASIYTAHRQQQAPRHNNRPTRRPFSMRMATKMVLLAALAFTLLGQAQALCACTLVYYTLCQRYDMSEVVVHATALARNVTGDTATYTLDIITLYKAEDGGNYTDEISFTTPASSDDCGVTLNIGEEYLVGLNDLDDDGVFSVWYCHGLFDLWSTVKNEVDGC